jgi:hypothetical protein
MFAIPSVEAARERDAIVFNEYLSRLMRLRTHQVSAKGSDNVSRIGWKLAAFRQGSIYRVVMLGQGASSAWNNCNVLSSILCARALLETIAKLYYLQTKLIEPVSTMDIEAISTLLDKQLFSTREEEWLEDGAGSKATNVVTMIEKFNAAVPGIMKHYDLLSEWCHPNWVGQQFLFATTDSKALTTTFSESRGRNHNVLEAIVGAIMIITKFEAMLEELDATATMISSA